MRLIAGLLVAAAAFTPCVPPPDDRGGWRTKTSEAAQAEKLDRVFDYIRQSTKNVGLPVVKDGWLICERYFGLGRREATPNLASCGKAFTSTAAGILLHERPGLFPDGLDQRVFTPRYLPPEALRDPAKSGIRPGQLPAMPAGIAGNNPGSVRGKPVRLAEPGPGGWQAMVDERAAAVPLWTKPGEGHSYATASVHRVSMMLRHVTGVELEQWIAKKIAAPMGWGRWGFGYQRPEIRHTPGGGGIAMRATDMLRFAWLPVNGGRRGGAQLVPAACVRHCGRMPPYNPHSPYSLQFGVNGGGHAAGAPRDAFGKHGSGGHAFYAAPSMKPAVFKPGGRDSQSTEKTTVPPPPPGAMPAGGDSRPGWKRSPCEGGGEAAVQTLRRVAGALR